MKNFFYGLARIAGWYPYFLIMGLFLLCWAMWSHTLWGVGIAIVMLLLAILAMFLHIGGRSTNNNPPAPVTNSTSTTTAASSRMNPKVTEKLFKLGKILFWVILVFTAPFWTGILGSSLRGGFDNFWSSMSNSVKETELPLSTLSYDLSNGRMIVIPPGEKTFLHIPHNKGTVWYNTGTVYVSGLGGDNVITKKSYHEDAEILTSSKKQPKPIGMGDYYLYTDKTVKDTVRFKITW